MAAPLKKWDGDPIGANITFGYKGPGASYNVGAIVETKPHVIFMMKEHYCEATYGSWSGQSVTPPDGVWNASFLDHGDLVTCLMVIYPSGIEPLPNGDSSIIKKSSGEIYVHQSEGPQEGDTKCVGADLYKYTGGEWVLTEANSPSCPVTPPPEESWWEDIVNWLTKYWYIVAIVIVALVIGTYMFTRKK